MRERLAFAVLPARKLAAGRLLMESVQTFLPDFVLRVICLDASPEQCASEIQTYDSFALVSAETIWGDEFTDRAFFYEEEIFCQVTAAKALASLKGEFSSCLWLQPGTIFFKHIPQLYRHQPDEVLSLVAPVPYEIVDPPLDISYGALRVTSDGFHLFSAGSAMGRFFEWSVKRFDYLREVGVSGNNGGQDHPQADYYSHWVDYATIFGCERIILDIPFEAPPYPGLSSGEIPAFGDYTALLWAMNEVEREHCRASNPAMARRFTEYQARLQTAPTPENELGYGFDYFDDDTPLFSLLRGYYGYNYRLRTACGGNPFAHRPCFTDETMVLGEETGVPLTAAMEAIYLSREDLQAVYPNMLGSQRADYARWFVKNGKEEYHLNNAYTTAVLAALSEQGNETTTHKSRLSNRLRKLLKVKRGASGYPIGVNLCGYIRGDLGIGENCRALGGMIDSAGIPLSVIELADPGMHTYTNTSWANRISNQFKYNTNILFTNASGLSSLFQTMSKDATKFRYNIGYWAWELPQFPEGWVPAFSLLDEVWTLSEFAAQSIRTKSSVPVFSLPPSVEVHDIDDRLTRADFGIPDNPFVFLLMYDISSVPARKNPEGAVKAFHKAFGGRRDVRLVIKVNAPPGAGSPEDRALLESLASQENVHLITDYLSRSQVNRLIQLCDACVSLHRCEGFGLFPAEGMYLGKPAIITGWSGNMEYTDADVACPVGYRLVEIDKDYGNYKKGMIWAEPNLEEAAAAMLKLVSDRDFYEKLSRKAAARIRECFSREALGRKAKERLEMLGLL